MREAHRQEKNERLKNEEELRLNLVDEKLQWFQNHFDPQKVGYSKKDACELTDRCLNRFNSEQEQTELHNSIKDRQGGRAVPRRQSASARRSVSNSGYEGYKDACGLEVPDAVNAGNLKTLREQDFDLKKLPSTTMRKTCANDALPKKCWKKTVTTVDKDLEELELKDDSALNALDAEMTAVA
uniref:Translation machinery-associated protein 16 n=1 Tax=Equus caballus TaxID=9796 RepID=F6T506_HORSE